MHQAANAPNAAEPLVDWLERGEQLLEEPLKLRDLVGIEARQELSIALGDRGDGLVDELHTLSGELDDDPTAIVWVR